MAAISISFSLSFCLISAVFGSLADMAVIDAFIPSRIIVLNRMPEKNNQNKN